MYTEIVYVNTFYYTSSRHHGSLKTYQTLRNSRSQGAAIRDVNRVEARSGSYECATLPIAYARGCSRMP